MFVPAISPAMLLIGVAVLAVIAFGAGFAVSNWRSGEEIEKLRGKSELLQVANGECAEDINSIRDAMKHLEIVSADRARRAGEAVKQAQTQADKHKARVVHIRSMPEVKPEAQCLAIEREQAAYVASRLEETK